MCAKTKIFLLLAAIIFSSCSSSDTAENERNKVIATFEDKKLYLSDLEGIIPPNATRQDSLNISSRYADSWLKKQLMLAEGGKTEKLNLDEINKKTEEYRNSLLVYEFQKEIISQKLDTIISDQELKDFYERHANDFELKKNIVKAIFIRSKNLSGLEKLNKAVAIMSYDKSNALIRQYCDSHADKCKIETDNWRTFDEIVLGSPFHTISNKTDWLSKYRQGIMKDEKYAYFIKVYAYNLENRISPLDFVKDQIKSIILSRRKLKIIADFEEELYNRALSEKKIEKY